MPMTINGSGSIAGLSAGGLPDASITQPDLATNVTSTGPAFSAYQSVAQSIPSVTFTKLTLDTEEFDTNSNFSSSRFTPTVAGYYSVFGETLITTSSLVLATIFKNNLRFKDGNNSQASTGASSVAALVFLNGSTDYIELFVYHNAGTSASTNIEIAPAANYFQAHLVRGA